MTRRPTERSELLRAVRTTVRVAGAAAVCAAGGALALALSPAAAIDDEKPVLPQGCVRALVDDPADAAYQVDSRVNGAVNGAKEVPGGTEITGLFFTERGGVLSANLEVSDLGAQLPDDVPGLAWRIGYHYPGDPRPEVSVVWLEWYRIDAAGASSHYAYHRPDGGDPTEIDAKPHPGEVGVVQFDLPLPSGGHKRIESVTASSYVMAELAPLWRFASEGADLQPEPTQTGYFTQVDSAGGLKSPSIPHVPGSCPPRVPETTTTTTQETTTEETVPEQTTTRDPSPTQPMDQPRDPGGRVPAVPPAGGTSAERAARPLAVSIRGRVSAKAAARRRAARVALLSQESLADVRARLLRGSAAVASGKLKRLPARRRVTLRLRVTRRLKPGRHTLVLEARRADGTTGDARLTTAVVR